MESSPLIDRAIAACADVFHDTRIILTYAYGSRVDGTATPKSDLDFGTAPPKLDFTPLVG